MSENFDVIVVGAGSAGSVIARRLVDAGRRVLVLEAGGEDTNPAIHDLSRQGEIWHSPDDWDYYTIPQPHAHNRKIHLPRGKVLGGSHALNAMIWVRGDRSDYDGWASAGNEGWAWDDVLPIFRDIENWHGTPSELRGTEGLLDVTDEYELDPIHASIIDAAEQIGVPRNPDYNGETLDGISQQQVTIRGGTRLNTYMAYLKPVRGNPLLTVVTGAWVHRLLFSGTRVTGVEYEVDGSLVSVSADETVLAAGALDSPRILMLSGIGRGSDLAAVGVDPRFELPGVGANLHDHLLSPVIFSTEREITQPRSGVSVTQTHLFWRSREGLRVPDTQPINFSIPWYEPWMSGPPAGFTLQAGIVTPKSRGSFKLTSADPHALGDIDIAALEHEDDIRSLVASVHNCLEIGAAPALAGDWGARNLYPGTEFADSVEDYVRRTVTTYHHQVGTCRMGVDDGAVVDPRLRVHGVEGLMVADASIMPTITTGNTNAPSVLIGEQAARFLLG